MRWVDKAFQQELGWSVNLLMTLRCQASHTSGQVGFSRWGGSRRPPWQVRLLSVETCSASRIYWRTWEVVSLQGHLGKQPRKQGQDGGAHLGHTWLLEVEN